MKDFKEIAEKCLTGELSGIFILRNTDKIRSSDIVRKSNLVCSYWNQLYGFFSDNGSCYSGYKHYSGYDIVAFIPDNTQKQIKIDIPEGKIPIMEQTESGVVITWKEKELTYDDIFEKLSKDKKYIGNFGYSTASPNLDTHIFYQKMGVLHKLVNIRNYFGKPKYLRDGVVIKCTNAYCGVETGQFYFDKPDLDSLHEVVFAKKEHAQEAINILGDEIKYLFEPW